MNLEKLADECGTDKGSHQGYMPIYERYLPGPDAPIVLCELGVQTGASLALWSKYFRHNNTRIMGLDIDPAIYKRVDDPRVEFYGVDCTDAQAAELLTAMRPVDIVVDDASHEGPDVSRAFVAWWPHLTPGGLYVIEDTHCSYDTSFYKWAGEPGKHNYTTMEFLKGLADDVDWNYHGYDRFTPLYKDIGFVHFYPGICFIGKKG